MQLKYGVSPYSIIMGMLSCTILAIILWAFRKNKFFYPAFRAAASYDFGRVLSVSDVFRFGNSGSDKGYCR